MLEYVKGEIKMWKHGQQRCALRYFSLLAQELKSRQLQGKHRCPRAREGRSWIRKKIEKNAARKP